MQLPENESFRASFKNLYSTFMNRIGQGGFTLVEILISLIVFAFGFALVSSALPVSLKFNRDMENSAKAQVIALNYFALLNALPADVNGAALRLEFKKVFFPSDAIADDSLPNLVDLSNSVNIIYDPPTDMSKGLFRDATAGDAGFFVRIAHCDSIDVPFSRVYSIAVGRESGEWYVFPFVRAGK